jgi:predicted DCC family thiol-disulfide oxidoreductase YuxK
MRLAGHRHYPAGALAESEGSPLAEQLGLNPDCPNSFAFLANGQAYVKSEAVLRIARELQRWQWTLPLSLHPHGDLRRDL